MPGKEQKFMFGLIRLAVLTAMFLYPLSSAALAVEWKGMTSTSRYQVALDEESVRLTERGRLAVWLRFIPLDDTQRKAAAAEYGEKGYRSHLEYYEIDCSEQSFLLGLIEIFGKSKTMLKRIKAGGETDAIVPGSVLDRTAERICPVPDDETVAEEKEIPPLPHGAENDHVTEEQPNVETEQKIGDLLKRTVAEPSNYQAWTLLGNAYFDADLPVEAIAAYNRALALRPDDTNILNDQGAMFRQKGEFANALANFERAVKIDPYNLESLYNSGYVYAFDLNNITKALQIWMRYLELDKSSEMARQVQSFVERYRKEKN
ncbi:MAG: tetratricopeptide repeat protein [Desulfuromonadaceae bacterium]|nr:tetratricopeptide repeat protein [Desulfuromonadaceae bacterium]